MKPHVRIDTKQINRILKNTVQYSYGFLEGTNINQIFFNQQLAEITSDALKDFIDAKARMNQEAFHHLYEWEMVGSPQGRLFDFNAKASQRVIHFYGKFLKSSTIGPESDRPFKDKANIMENQIAVTVEPKKDMLVFDVDDTTVFTTKSVYIANPGGDEVAGSFGRATEEFFEVHFTNTFLRQSGIFEKLGLPIEYSQNFARGAKGGGRSAGRLAGKSYMTIKGVGR